MLTSPTDDLARDNAYLRETVKRLNARCDTLFQWVQDMNQHQNDLYAELRRANYDADQLRAQAHVTKSAAL